MTAVPPPTDLAAWLTELEAAHAAATPGEWAVWWRNRIGTGIDISPSGGVSLVHYVGAVADEDDRADYDNEPNPGSPEADAALIVAAVNALPRLVAAVRAVEALADELEREAFGDGKGTIHAAGALYADRIRAALGTGDREGQR